MLPLERIYIAFHLFVKGPGLRIYGFGKLLVETIFSGVDWVTKTVPLESQIYKKGPFW